MDAWFLGGFHLLHICCQFRLQCRADLACNLPLCSRPAHRLPQVASLEFTHRSAACFCWRAGALGAAMCSPVVVSNRAGSRSQSRTRSIWPPSFAGVFWSVGAVACKDAGCTDSAVQNGLSRWCPLAGVERVGKSALIAPLAGVVGQRSTPPAGAMVAFSTP